jgi:hypothetical protein
MQSCIGMNRTWWLIGPTLTLPVSIILAQTGASVYLGGSGVPEFGIRVSALA